MLIKKINSTIDLIDEVKKLENQSHEHEDYNSFRKLLKKNKRNTFNQFINSYEILYQYNNDFFDIGLTDYPLNLISNIIDDLDNYKCPSPKKMFQLENIISQYNSKLSEKWEKYVGTNTKDIINILDNIKALYNNPKEISELIDGLEGLKGKWPITSKDIDNLKNKIARGKNIIDQLDVDENVQIFLQKISQGDATLIDLDQETLNWLDKNNFKDKLSITFNTKRG